MVSIPRCERGDVGSSPTLLTTEPIDNLFSELTLQVVMAQNHAFLAGVGAGGSSCGSSFGGIFVVGLLR